MHREEKGTEYGLVKIHRNVIAQVASIAALEVDGVSRISMGLFARFLSSMSAGKIKREPIKIEFKENNEVSIQIGIVVNYGVNIPAVALNVQENIKKSTEKMIGLYPTEINIKVKGVEVKK